MGTTPTSKSYVDFINQLLSNRSPKCQTFIHLRKCRNFLCSNCICFFSPCICQKCQSLLCTWSLIRARKCRCVLAKLFIYITML